MSNTTKNTKVRELTDELSGDELNAVIGGLLDDELELATGGVRTYGPIMN